MLTIMFVDFGTYSQSQVL